MRDSFTLWFVDETKQDGTTAPVWLGTKLRDGKNVPYSVNYGTAVFYMNEAKKNNPESRFEIRSENH